MNNENKNQNTNDSYRRRFNVIDAVIVILVILCIVSVIYRFDFIDGIGVSDNNEEYQLYFEIENIRNTSVDFLVSGDTVRNSKTNDKIGVLDEILLTTPALAAYNKNGEEIFYPEISEENEETRYYVTGYITVSGRMTENGFLLNGSTYIAANSELAVATENIETTIKVLEINKK